jgi:transcription elongation factor Elf1
MKISLESYRKPDGTIDYEAYLKWIFDEEKMSEHRWFDNGSEIVHAQIQLGQACQSCCGGFERPPVEKAPRECDRCKHINDVESIVHQIRIRCPYCKVTSNVDPLIDFEKYPYGYTCKNCSMVFEVQRIPMFVSPPLNIKT